MIEKAGDLAILWNPKSVDLKMMACDSRRCITIKVECIQSKFCFFLYNIYAPNIIERRRIWDFLRGHRSSSNIKPWFIGGDFNTPLNLEDKYGGCLNLIRGMNELRDFINFEKLIDLPLKGHKFTCSNRRVGKHLIQRRLDRMVCFVD